MPQRTNDFQELVSRIRRAFAREGDTIEDSAMVEVREIEKEREIDILHRTTDGFSIIKISVEVKDEKRPLSVTKIEELWGKYQGRGSPQIDKLVIVARNG